MAVHIDDIQRQARQLPEAERLKLAEAMLESVRTPLADIDAAWDQEIEARVAAFDRGELPPYPAGDVFAEARRISR